MQNVQQQHDLLMKKLNQEEPDLQSSWLILWSKEWNISKWLMSSFISCLIFGEIYAIILSVNPNFIISIWLALGIQSLVLTSMLTFFTIVSLSLITGALVYSIQLALTSMQNYEKIYLPLIETWSNNSKNYGPILVQLLSDRNFLKITESLNNYPAAQPLVDFLKNDENAESVHKILVLLREIWSQDTIDMQIKTLIINLLTQYVQKDDAKLHIDNIWKLWEFLEKHEELNLEMVLNVLQNSSQVQEFVGQIETFNQDPQLIKQALAKPEMLTYVKAINAAVPRKSLLERANSMRQVYENSTNPIMSWPLFHDIENLDESEQKIRMAMMNEIINHPQFPLISALFSEIQTQKPNYFNEIKKTKWLIYLFQNEITQNLDIKILAKIIIKLEEYNCLELTQTQALTRKNNLGVIHELLESYSSFSSIDLDKNKSNIQNILQVQATQLNEIEKQNFLKAFNEIQEPAQPKKHSFLKKPNVFKALLPNNKNKTNHQHPQSTSPHHKKENVKILSAHEIEYQLFKKKKAEQEEEQKLTANTSQTPK